jgi:hypothetical protein
VAVESWRMVTEIALALVALPASVVGRLTGSVAALTVAILVILTGQLIAIWHQFNRRTDRVVLGRSAGSEGAHLGGARNLHPRDG